MDPASPLNTNSATRPKITVRQVAVDGTGFRTTGGYQEDFASIWLEAIGLVHRASGYGKRRINILTTYMWVFDIKYVTFLFFYFHI